MNFKIGDKVRVKNNLHSIKNFRGGYEKKMDNLIGKIVTISEIEDECISIEEDPYGFYWDERAFEPVIKTKQDIEDGDIVTLRNGDKLYYELESDTFHDINYGNCNNVANMRDFDDNMTSEDGDEYDIVKIERAVKYDTIYDRNGTVKEMSLKEICDALGYEVKIVKEEK